MFCDADKQGLLLFCLKKGRLEIFMNTRKIISYIVLCVVFALLGFYGGVLLGHLKQEKNAPVPVADDTAVGIYQSGIYENESTGEDTTYYLLQNEDNTLKMYEITGDNKSLIKSIALNFSFLPPEDRENLNKGIKFTDKEYGYSLIEDYTS